MRRSLVIVVPLIVFAAGCDRAERSDGESVVLRQDTQGREAERRRSAQRDVDEQRAQARRDEQEPIGAAPEDRAAPMPGQAAEAPTSPGAVSRSPGTDELYAPTDEVTREMGPEEQMQPIQEPRQAARRQPETAPTGAPARGGAAGAAAAGRAAQRSLEGRATEQPSRTAVAELESDAAGDVEGTVVLTEDETGVLLEANVAGLEPGTHRVVIRETASCDEAAESATRATQQGEEQAARSAQTPTDAREEQRTRQARGAPVEAAGEQTIGEVEVGPGGTMQYRLLTNQLALEESGPDSVIGKTVVIEAEPSSAAEEEPVACGVIESAG